MKNKFYITTTLPYVNADPHIGFALEMVQADAIARYHILLGKEVFFNTGTDEHGKKIYQKAVEKGVSPKAYCDEYAEKFKKLMPALGILQDVHFIRTTDEHHIKACQEFWTLCEKNGDIYKQKYKIKYCVGCELEKTESELNENGRCPIHPNLEIEQIEEENYFFRWSKYQKPLLEYYEKHPDFVVPDFRFKEIKQFVKRGLQDFSISRLKEKMPWGVPVPGDETQVMYVWFDALINYVSTLGWGDNAPHSPLKIRGGEYHPFNSPPILGGEGQNGGVVSKFEQFWGTLEHPNAIQIAGKDNLRQQSAMWQAMLMSAGLPNSKQIIIHGFIISGGQKMSKSLGNVADPYQILDMLQAKGLSREQAIDALRYYLLREIPTFEDGDYTWERFVESYNANLANGIGNLTSRILKMAANASCSAPIYGPTASADESARYICFLPWQGEGREGSNNGKIDNLIENYELQKIMDKIWQKISACDEYIQKTEPFKKIKVDEVGAKKDIEYLLSGLNQIAHMLQPFLPNTAGKILNALKAIGQKNIPRLFPRIE